MTLSTQNKLLLWFSAISVLTGILFIVGIVLFFLENGLYLPWNQSSEGLPSLTNFFFEQSTIYTIFSIAIFSLYVPIVGFTVYFTFEKTKAPEMLYFTSMLIGFFSQTLLLCIPLFSLQNGYSQFLRTISSIAFFGQVQVILSILLQGVLVSQEGTRDADRFFALISVIALTFAVIIPIDLKNIQETFTPKYGFEGIFTIIRSSFILITFASMFLSPNSKKSKDYKKASIAFFILCIGYVALLNTANLINFCIGAACLLFGTTYFLRRLHSYYMWK